MEDSVTQRLNLLVETFEKGVKSAFANRIGISQQGAHDLLGSRKGGPSFKVLTKILESYPQIRIEWLVLGRGPMLQGEAPAVGEAEVAAPQRDYVTREQYQGFMQEVNQEIKKQKQLFEAYKLDVSEKAQLEQVYRIGDMHAPNKLADRLNVTEEEARDLVLSGRIRSAYVGKDDDRARRNGVSYRVTERAVREFLGEA